MTDLIKDYGVSNTVQSKRTARVGKAPAVKGNYLKMTLPRIEDSKRREALVRINEERREWDLPIMDLNQMYLDNKLPTAYQARKKFMADKEKLGLDPANLDAPFKAPAALFDPANLPERVRKDKTRLAANNITPKEKKTVLIKKSKLRHRVIKFGGTLGVLSKAESVFLAQHPKLKDQWLLQHEAYLRSHSVDHASSSISYLMPVGEIKSPTIPEEEYVEALEPSLFVAKKKRPVVNSGRMLSNEQIRVRTVRQDERKLRHLARSKWSKLTPSDRRFVTTDFAMNYYFSKMNQEGIELLRRYATELASKPKSGLTLEEELDLARPQLRDLIIDLPQFRPHGMMRNRRDKRSVEAAPEPPKIEESCDSDKPVVPDELLYLERSALSSSVEPVLLGRVAPNAAQTLRLYGVKVHKLKKKLRSSLHPALTDAEVKFLKAYPEKYFDFLMAAEPSIRSQILDIVMSHNPLLRPHGARSRSRSRGRQGKGKSRSRSRSRSRGKKSVTLVVPGSKEKIKITPKKFTKAKKLRNRRGKRLDAGVSRETSAGKQVKETPMMADSTKFSSGSKVFQQIYARTVAPAIIKSFPVSILELGKIQNLFSAPGAPPGAITANAVNYLWANTHKIVIRYQGNAPATLGGKILFVASPYPLNDAGLSQYLTSRQMAGGKWASDVREFNASDFSPANGKSAVGNFHLNIIKGDRPIGVNSTDSIRDISPILCHFSIIQYEVDTVMQYGGVPSASSSETIVYDQLAQNRLCGVEYHLDCSWIFRCGGVKADSTAVTMETSVIQTTQKNIAAVGAGPGKQQGGPLDGLLTPDEAAQGNNSVTLFGVKGQPPVTPPQSQIQIGPDFVDQSTLVHFVNEDTGEIVSFVITTCVEALATAVFGPVAGTAVAMTMPFVEQLVIFGVKSLWGFMARITGNPDVADQKTAALNAANGVHIDRLPIIPVGATNLMGCLDPTQRFTGYTAGPLVSMIQSMKDYALTLPANTVAGGIARMFQACQFQGCYPHWVVSGGTTAPSANMSILQQDFEVTEGGVEAYYPTCAGTYTDASSEFAGIPALFTKVGPRPYQPITVSSSSGDRFVQPNRQILRIFGTHEWFDDTDRRNFICFPAVVVDPGDVSPNADDSIDTYPWRFAPVPYDAASDTDAQIRLNMINFYSMFFNTEAVINPDDQTVSWNVCLSYDLVGRASIAQNIPESDQQFYASKTRAFGTQTTWLKRMTQGVIKGVVTVNDSDVQNWQGFDKNWDVLATFGTWNVIETLTKYDFGNGDIHPRPVDFDGVGADHSYFHCSPNF